MPDLERILCPIDFSDASKHAIEHAVAMARWYHASITALHVWNPVFPAIPEFAAVGAEEVAGSSAVHFEQLRRELLAAFSADERVDPVIAQGPPALQILVHAASAGSQLIVMGTHGHSGFEALVLGSISEKVLRKAPCPVLLVPPRAQRTSRLPFQRILCPVDFSSSSQAALDLAVSFGQHGDAEVTVLHVIESPDDQLPLGAYAAPEYQRQRENDALARLGKFVPPMTPNWRRPVTRLGHGKPYREILGTAASDDADLIVMGVHGRNPIDVMLLGSTTNQVVRRATCPVLTVRH